MLIERWFHKAHAIVAVSLTIALGGSVLAGCDWLGKGQKDSAVNEKQKIKIAQVGDFFLYAPLYVAIDAGFFEKNGLDVSLISTGGDEKTWAAVISGQASFGVADPTFVAVSGEKGQPGKVISSIVNGVPFWGVALNPAVKVEKDQDLAKYSVATFPAPSTAFTLQEDMFQDAHLKPNIKQGAFGTLLGILRAKKADIALELEPNVSQAVAKDGAKIVYSFAKRYGDFAITGLTASPKLLKENPILAEKVVCSIQMSLEFIHKNKDKSLDILAKRFPEIDRNVAASAFSRVVDEDIVPESTVIEKTAWDKAIKLRTEVGDVKNPQSIETYVDNSFAQKAKNSCHYNTSTKP
jgi:NitT/TauT family transport system substrate-binding protein